MGLRKRIILTSVASAVALGGVGAVLYRLTTAKDSHRIGPDGVAAAKNLVYTTRPLRREEMRVQMLPVAFPATATDFQFAEFGYWLVGEFYFSFRAPPDVCLAYAQAVLDEHNKRNPKEPLPGLRPVGSGEEPVNSRPLTPFYLTNEGVTVSWFQPGAIREGVEGGERGSKGKVWVDTERGVFYYESFH